MGVVVVCYESIFPKGGGFYYGLGVWFLHFEENFSIIKNDPVSGANAPHGEC